MTQTTFDHEEGFTFTDQDFERRYSPEEEIPSVAEAGNPSAPPAQQGKPVAARIHGGGNSFMRARRRRLASSGRT